MTKTDLKVVKKVDEPAALTRVSVWSDDELTDEALEREWNERMAALSGKPKPHVHRRIVSRSLSCTLTEDERAEYVEEICQADRLKAKLEDDLENLKDRQKEIKANIDGKDKVIRKNRLILDAGSVERLVEIEIRVDYDNDEVVEIRTDTGEELLTRPLRPNERQMPLEAA